VPSGRIWAQHGSCESPIPRQLINCGPCYQSRLLLGPSAPITFTEHYLGQRSCMTPWSSLQVPCLHRFSYLRELCLQAWSRFPARLTSHLFGMNFFPRPVTYSAGFVIHFFSQRLWHSYLVHMEVHRSFADDFIPA